ncbi:MAG TPA: nuclear transport factor 2 family protein [Candidatus Cybelea sp.]|nr:nuclear transport factor 2 family protein [Candidatus Cybelea sp.]
MSGNLNELVDRYIATWNETDGARRRALVGKTFTETASYVDPMMLGDGQAGIDAMIAGAQSRFGGMRFRLSGKIDAFKDRVRFSWELGADNRDAYVKGTDFAVIADGRLQSVTGFIDQMPA